ncbi:Dabb family protein [Emticicia fontis]
MANLKKGLVHTVFFWLKDQNNQADHQALHEGLLELSKIDLIQTAYVGTPANTNRAVIDFTYQFSITWIFDTPEQQAAYQTHPDHLAFVAKCSHLWEKVQVYDAES